jgi:hypothetical protein
MSASFATHSHWTSKESSSYRSMPTGGYLKILLGLPARTALQCARHVRKCGLLGHIATCTLPHRAPFHVTQKVQSGGGSTDNVQLDLSRPPFRWMCFEAAQCGLRMEPILDLKRDEKIIVTQSLTWAWWCLEAWPFKRLDYKGCTSTTWQYVVIACFKFRSDAYPVRIFQVHVPLPKGKKSTFQLSCTTKSTIAHKLNTSASRTIPSGTTFLPSGMMILWSLISLMDYPGSSRTGETYRSNYSCPAL